MHEMALMKDIVRKIQQVGMDAGAARIKSVSVWIGALSHLTASHFMDHFREDSAGTLAQGATVYFDVSDDFNHPQARDVILKSVEVSDA